MNTISFFTPVVLDRSQKSPKLFSIGRFAEEYFYFGGKKACVISASPNGGWDCRMEEAKCSVLSTALKIASFATLVIPLIFLTVKAIFRSLNHFESTHFFPLEKASYPQTVKTCPRETQTLSGEGECYGISSHKVKSRPGRTGGQKMEDAFLHSHFNLILSSKIVRGEAFSVIDGHGGDRCAQFIKANLIDELQEAAMSCSEEGDEWMRLLLKKTFKQLDTKWSEHKEKRDFSGACLLLACIINNALWIANAGDCRAVLKWGDTVYQLTDDAKAGNPRFQKKVDKLGGEIMPGRLSDIPRLCGRYAVVRAIGDGECPGMTCSPKITKVSLDRFPGDKQLILATDGLWDVVGSDEITEVLMGIGPSEFARHLHKLAFERGTKDDTTIIVKNIP